MARHPQKWSVAALLVALGPLSPLAAPAATPPVSEALKLKPVQNQIDYDVPDKAAVEKCTLEPFKLDKLSGWEVRDGDGNVLRRYLDSNADNKVDQWCYFKNGVEVYRDIDGNHNRKADQYRWLGTAGIRWAIDSNEDGRIDSWKVISPEEVSEEVVLALSTRDASRFQRLLLTPAELRDLQLGEAQAKQLAQKLAQTAAGFEKLVAQQDFVDRDARWVNFGGTRPGVVPAGTEGSQRDLHVYENAAAVIESGGTHNQIIIGTLVQAQDVWRLVDLPRSITDAQASTGPEGFFFTAVLRRAEADIPVTGGLSPEVQRLISEMEQVDKDLTSATTPAALAQLNARRADVLEKLAQQATDDEDRVTWLRQLADTVSAAAQAGGYPQGIERLAALCQELEQQKGAPELISYIKFRCLSAEYGQSMQEPDADFAKIQDKWLADLEQFVKDYANTPDAAEAMLQLAVAEEFSGDDEGAVNWYGQISSQFPDTQVAAKASGAKRRIESVGQTLSLTGKDSKGNTISVDAYRGKVVLVHYWATWCGPCKQDISVLKDMQTKYGKENVMLIGVNVDNDRTQLDAYMAENNLAWPQLYAPGGLDSPLANAFGILTLPTMILADKEGKVVNRNLNAGEVDSELRKLLR